MKFSDLGLSEKTLQAITEVGYETPTPIQEKAIPEILKRNDVLGIAQTGTGKTAAFTLPMIDILSSGRAKALMPRTLILSPTRELATQIAECFQSYGKYQKLSMALLIGGESVSEQQKILSRGVDVLIATPGRMIDLCDRGRVLLRDVQVFVLDEADRMLDMGFIPDVERIIAKVPSMRQTLLFSATMLPEIKALAAKFMRFPVEVRVDPEMSTADTVEQFIVKSHKQYKKEVLRKLLRREDIQNAMIFCNRKKDVDALFGDFKSYELPAVALHGDMTQSQRTEMLRAFKEGETKFLICSDVAARGLDLPSVSHVFNFDVPINPEDYIHRIGRTGRAGRTGKAFMIVTSYDTKPLDAIEKMIGQKLSRAPFSSNSKKTNEEAESETKKRRQKRRQKAKLKKQALQNQNQEQKKPIAPPQEESIEKNAALKEEKKQSKVKKPKVKKPKMKVENNKPKTQKQSAPPASFGATLPAFLTNEIKI